MKDNKFHAIVVADLHYGSGNEDHLNSEVQEILLKKIKKERKTLDLVEILGDSSHRQLSMNEKAGKYQSSLFHSINNLSLQNDFYFRVIRGTYKHDFNQLEVYRKLELINDKFRIFNTVTDDTFTLKDGNEISILQVPEEYVDDFDSHYKNFFPEKFDDETEPMYDFAMVHGTFDFAGYVSKLQTSERSMKNAPTFKSKNFDLMTYGCTMSGHIHTPMNKNNVFYCGSFSRFSFGEEEPKGFYEIFYDLETLELELNFIENTLAPTYITINTDELPKNTKDKMKYINDFKKKYDFIRLKTTDNIKNEENLEMLKEFSKKDKSIKIFVKHEDSERTNHDYDFLFDDKLNKSKKMIKFSKLKLNEDISLEIIKKVFEDSNVKDIDVFLQTS